MVVSEFFCQYSVSQAYPDAANPREGPDVPWTSGLVDISGLSSDPNIGSSIKVMPYKSFLQERVLQLGILRRVMLVVQVQGSVRKFHVVITAEGTAVHWQSRVHYYWFLKIKKECESKGNCEMGGFTRILHSGKPDDLMEEIPTFVVEPLPAEKHDHHGYVVLNRPYAFVQWTQKAKIAEDYVLMSEPDHIWLKPMPNLMKVIWKVGGNPYLNFLWIFELGNCFISLCAF
jgi:hydroxyproline O-arabinosyltransferase